ncbi:MAG TPA: type II secretion system protein [Verrucomicrobiae bacterium]|nr:type II secretion system protein [Verrucomicrobiae bacterium]
MKTSTFHHRNGAMTLIELLVVLAVITVLVAFVFVRSGRAKDGNGYARIRCLNNLKQAGLAFRIWEGDNSDKYPMAVSCTNGGAMEFTSGPNAFRTFQVMSNEISTPKVLICPMETDNTRFIATNFNDFCNSNISYFVGLDAAETNATTLLLGDHNITNGTPLKNGLLALTTNRLAGWTKEVHNQIGNICLADGNVQQDSTTGLQDQIAQTGVVTNRLLMPILGP